MDTKQSNGKLSQEVQERMNKTVDSLFFFLALGGNDMTNPEVKKFTGALSALGKYFGNETLDHLVSTYNENTQEMGHLFKRATEWNPAPKRGYKRKGTDKPVPKIDTKKSRVSEAYLQRDKEFFANNPSIATLEVMKLAENRAVRHKQAPANKIFVQRITRIAGRILWDEMEPPLEYPNSQQLYLEPWKTHIKKKYEENLLRYNCPDGSGQKKDWWGDAFILHAEAEYGIEYPEEYKLMLPKLPKEEKIAPLILEEDVLSALGCGKKPADPIVVPPKKPILPWANRSSTFSLSLSPRDSIL